jgi:hypothetical protein
MSRFGKVNQWLSYTFFGVAPSGPPFGSRPKPPTLRTGASRGGALSPAGDSRSSYAVSPGARAPSHYLVRSWGSDRPWQRGVRSCRLDPGLSAMVLGPGVTGAQPRGTSLSSGRAARVDPRQGTHTRKAARTRARARRPSPPASCPRGRPNARAASVSGETRLAPAASGVPRGAQPQRTRAPGSANSRLPVREPRRSPQTC